MGQDFGSFDPNALPWAPGGSMMLDTGQDLSQPGAGADPFGGSDTTGGAGDGSDTSMVPEAATIGMLPGGVDGQYSPFSPGGGFDYTNALGFQGGSAVSNPFSLPLSSLTAWGNLGGPYGVSGGTGNPPPNLGTSPSVQINPNAASYGMVTAAQARRLQLAAILRAIRQSTGMRVTGKSITGLIVHYGFQAASALLRTGFQNLLQIFLDQKGRPHRRRGPHLYTVARRLRAADRLRHTASRILGRACAPQHRGAAYARAPYFYYRRRRRRRK